MNLNVVPPLAFTSALSVAASLYYHEDWSNSDTMSLIPSHVEENAKSLLVPQIVKDRILTLIQPVGEELDEWFRTFHFLYSQHTRLYPKISWTSLGTIDYRSTASKFITTEECTDKMAFKLACASGNDEHILRLWPVVQESMVQEMTSSGFKVRNPYKRLVLWPTLWTAYLNNQMEDYITGNGMRGINGEYEIFFCQTAVRFKCGGICNFFIEKFNGPKKKQVVKNLCIQCIHLDKYFFSPSLFLSLFFRMDDTERREILATFSYELLTQFLKWPLSNLYKILLEDLWPSFPFEHVSSLLEKICFKIMQTQIPRTYENIFATLWLKVPLTIRQEYFDSHICYILEHLFKPNLLQHTLTELISGTDAYKSFTERLLRDPDAVLIILIEENKFTAFRNLYKQLFPEVSITRKWENKYAIYTQSYVDEYYGTSIETSSESGSDMYLD